MDNFNKESVPESNDCEGFPHLLSAFANSGRRATDKKCAKPNKTESEPVWYEGAD